MLRNERHTMSIDQNIRHQGVTYHVEAVYGRGIVVVPVRGQSKLDARVAEWPSDKLISSLIKLPVRYMGQGEGGEAVYAAVSE